MNDFEVEREEYAPPSNIYSGANWFYWVAILSAINTLLVYYFKIANTPLALATTQWVDGTTGRMTSEGWQPPLHWDGIIINLLIAAVFAAFGYFARRGSDFAFVAGMFIYVVDALLAIGLKDFFGFAFHLIPLFFMFKGLLASRHLRESATSF